MQISTLNESVKWLIDFMRRLVGLKNLNFGGFGRPYLTYELNINIYKNSASLIVNICMFYLFVNKYLYVTIRLMVTKLWAAKTAKIQIFQTN